jgi:tetratricopeptide (TPR) repeat protein
MNLRMSARFVYRNLPRGVLIAILAACMVSRADAQLGSINFPTSGGEEAQGEFLRGVLLLHSFEYDDAAEAFRTAQDLNPDFAMAYWGEAMTRNRAIWGHQFLDEGRAILDRLGGTPEERRQKALTQRERDYLDAVEVLFGEGERADRQRAYRDRMRRVYEDYPDDLEAASFYALSILGAVDDGRDFAAYMKAAGIAEQVFEVNREHPGAVHYLIHAYDDPVHAPLGLRPARVYAGIAPDATHALHMPSHIFVALGMWDDVVASNEESWAASVRRMERKGLGAGDKSFHALMWLHYGLLQQGRFDEAAAKLDQMVADNEVAGTRGTRFHLARMRAHHIIETEEWEGPALDLAVDVSDLGLVAFVAHHFSTGYAAARRGEMDLARDELNVILLRLDEAGEDQDTGAAGVMTSELIAVVDHAEGKLDLAIEELRDVVAVESSLPFAFGPPEIAKPSAELLGEMLLEVEDYDGAVVAFESALERAPGRRLAQRGLRGAMGE